MTDNTLTPSQEAREAAEDAYYTCFEEEPGRSWLDALLAGKHDNDPLVQTFARFEQAIRRDEAEKCARRVLRLKDPICDDPACVACDTISASAAAIRARHADTDQTGGK